MFKPVILLGNGCRNNPQFIKTIEGLNVPVLVTWQAMDLIPEDGPNFCGRPGTFGQRAANIIIQKASNVFCFGTRLDGETVGYDIQNFGHAVHVWDCDIEELCKLPDSFIKHEVDLNHIDSIPINLYCPDADWLTWCKNLYHLMRPEIDGKQDTFGVIDPQYFMNVLSDVALPTDVMAIGSSSWAVNSFLQCFKVKRGQRVTVCSSIGAMGADIPMAIGAAVETDWRVITITGDGGSMLNIQELEVIRRLQLNIKLFIFNNGGYGSIRAMQNTRFDGHKVGCDAESGMTLPIIKKQADAYGISYTKLDAPIHLLNLARFMDKPYPQIFEVMVSPDWMQYPRVMSSMKDGKYTVDALENMTPKMDTGELLEIMNA
jgi:acetolactate synthase-1/2/3 large subunit